MILPLIDSFPVITLVSGQGNSRNHTGIQSQHISENLQNLCQNTEYSLLSRATKQTWTSWSRLRGHDKHLNINYKTLCRHSRRESPINKTNHMLPPEWLDTVENTHTHSKCKEISDETASSETRGAAPN